MTFTLTNGQAADVSAAITSGRAFIKAVDFPLGVAIVDHLTADGSVQAVVGALAAYQNPDGGFGRGLEVDIKAPDSNPFATRLAMTALLALPEDAAPAMKASLQAWLVTNQAPDGDWHLSPETRAGDLAPWFRAWQHPNLNPACCVAGLAIRLGIATPEMLARTAALFAEQASLEQMTTGGFYDLLPYAEYVTSGADIPERDAYLTTLATTIAQRTGEIYTDASHFWEQVMAAGPELMDRLPASLLAEQSDALLAEQENDGGWPTPYDAAWRPWATTSACLILAQLADQG